MRVFAIFCILAAGGLGQTGASATVGGPGLEYLYSANATITGATPVGLTPVGNMTVLSFDVGTVWGTRINGEITRGTDNLYFDNSGVPHTDARYLISTDDGASIAVQHTGAHPTNGDVALIHIQFATGDERYSDLNYAAGVGFITPSWEYLVFDVYKLVQSSSKDDGSKKKKW